MCLLNSHERSPFVLPVAAEQWSCLGDGISLPGQSPGKDAQGPRRTGRIPDRLTMTGWITSSRSNVSKLDGSFWLRCLSTDKKKLDHNKTGGTFGTESFGRLAKTWHKQRISLLVTEESDMLKLQYFLICTSFVLSVFHTFFLSFFIFHPSFWPFFNHS